MRHLRFLLVLLALFAPFSVFATPAKPLSIEEHNKLVPSRICLDNAAHLLKKGVLPSQAAHDKAVAECLAGAKEALGRDIAFNELVSGVGTSYELHGLQKAAGWLAGFSLLQALAAVGIAVFGSVFAFYAFPVFVAIPKSFYEAGLYATSLGLTGYGLTLSDGYIWGFMGTLFFGGALAFSSKIRGWQGSPTRYSAMVFVYAAIAAVLYQSTLIGFIAVTALMSMAGFVADAWGLGYVIGFKNEKVVPQATAVAFLVLGFYMALRIFNVDDPSVKVFAPGAYWMGTFVGYLGILIMASKWYGDGVDGRYMAMNVLIMPLAGVAAILLGSIYGVPEVQKIGGTFFGLWMIEKYVEVTFRGLLSGSFFGLLGSIALFYATSWAIANAEKVGPYLLFIS